MGPWDFLQGTPSSSEYRGLPWHHANAKHSLPGDVQVMLRQSVQEKPWKSESIIRKEVWFDKRLTCFCQNIKPLWPTNNSLLIVWRSMESMHSYKPNVTKCDEVRSPMHQFVCKVYTPPMVIARWTHSTDFYIITSKCTEGSKLRLQTKTTKTTWSSISSFPKYEWYEPHE